MAKGLFKCKANEVEAIDSNILEKLNVTYEEANNDASMMAALSRRISEQKGFDYCRLPFCHTVEAEAFGSKVIFDSELGNRISGYSIDGIDFICELPEIDLNSGRISEVLDAITILKQCGEKVVLDVTGPISTATSVMDSRLFYRFLRKDKENADKFLQKIEDGIVDFMLEGIRRGTDVISYADPTGTIDIVGPKVYEEVSGKLTVKILKRIEKNLEKSIVHICGKTSTSLESIGLLESVKIESQGENYFEMIKNARKNRKDINFIGHWCMKLEKKNNMLTYCVIK